MMIFLTVVFLLISNKLQISYLLKCSNSNFKITETHSDQSDLSGLTVLDVFLTVSERKGLGLTDVSSAP